MSCVGIIENLFWCRLWYYGWKLPIYRRVMERTRYFPFSRIPLNEFSRPGHKPELNVGEETEVYIENVDNANGETVLSREKAVKQQAWHNLQESFSNNLMCFALKIYYVTQIKNLTLHSNYILRSITGTMITPILKSLNLYMHDTRVIWKSSFVLWTD